MNNENTKTRFAQFFGGSEPEFIFEDEQCVVFDEQDNKQAPVHFLVVPKQTINRLIDATVDDEQLLGHLLLIARRIAAEKGISNTGFRVVMNEGVHSCQTVEQFYVQVLGHLLLVAKQVATDKGLNSNGYHVMFDIYPKDEKLRSLHVFGRALHHMLWPVGPGFKL